MRKNIKHNVNVVKDNSLGANALNLELVSPASCYIFLFSLTFPHSLPYLVLKSSFLLYMLRRHGLKVSVPRFIFKVNWERITEIFTVETCCVQQSQSLLESKGSKRIMHMTASLKMISSILFLLCLYRDFNIHKKAKGGHNSALF